MLFNLIQNLHFDVADLLDADEKMQHVSVITERPRGMDPGSLLFNARVKKWLAGQVLKNGKGGLALLVSLPEGTPQARGHTGLAVDFEFTVRAIELPGINDQDNIGTKMSVEELLIEAMLILQAWVPVRGHPLRILDFGPVEIDEAPSARAWDFVVATHDGQQARDKCQLPKFPAGSPNVEITTATAGASIYFTTDGTLPTSLNGTLYTTPIDVSGGGVETIRAMAYKAGMMASDCARLDV